VAYCVEIGGPAPLPGSDPGYGVVDDDKRSIVKYVDFIVELGERG
jgi:hypothetical protein